MRRCDRADWRAAGRRRALVVSLAVSLAGGLVSAPFALGGCQVPNPLPDPNNIPRDVTITLDQATKTVIVSGTAELESPLVAKKYTVAIISPTSVSTTVPVVLMNGSPIPVSSTVDVTTSSVLLGQLQAANVFTPGNEIAIVYETPTPFTVDDGDQFTVAVQQLPNNFTTNWIRLGAGGMTREDIDDGPPFPTLSYVDRAAGFQIGANPGDPPTGAAAWKTVNPEVLHSDGPFARPGQPNPAGYLVLDPLQIGTFGLFWANPDASPYIHAHGSYSGPPSPHPDPQPPKHGHGALQYLPAMTASQTLSATEIPANATVTVSATATTAGLGLSAVDLYVDNVLSGTDTLSPFEFIAGPFSVTANASLPVQVVAVDHNGHTLGSTSSTLTVYAPPSPSLLDAPTAVLATQPGSFTLQIAHGAAPVTVTAFVNDEPFAQQTGAGSVFVLPYTPPAVVVPTPAVARMDVVDHVSQTGSVSHPFTIAPVLQGSLRLTPFPTVQAGAPVFVELDATGTAISGTFYANGDAFDGFSGGTGTYSTIYQTLPSPVTTPLQVSAVLFDTSFAQVVTATANPLHVIGSNDTLQLMIAAPPSGIEVLENTTVTVIGQVLGGYNGLALARLYADGGLEASIPTPTAGVEFEWQARIPGPGLLQIQGAGSPGVPVALTIDAVDSVGQVGTSPPVVVFVLPAGGQIPALGGAALAALALLVGGLGVRAVIRRA